MTEIDQETQSQAQAIQNALRDSVTATRDNRELTDDAKHRRLVAAYDSAKEQMDRLEQRWSGFSSDRLDRLRREVFGTVPSNGMDAINVRDARDRANRIDTEQEALEELEFATENGDDALARAVLHVAFRRWRESPFGDWSDVLNAYAEKRPSEVARLDELIGLEKQSVRAGMMQTLVFSVAVPPEIQNPNGTVRREPRLPATARDGWR